jgi:hypothetical protein
MGNGDMTEGAKFVAESQKLTGHSPMSVAVRHE